MRLFILKTLLYWNWYENVRQRMASQCEGTLAQKVLCFSKFITLHLVETLVKKALLWASGVHKAPQDAAAFWEGGWGESPHIQNNMYCGFLHVAFCFSGTRLYSQRDRSNSANNYSRPPNRIFTPLFKERHKMNSTPGSWLWDHAKCHGLMYTTSWNMSPAKGPHMASTTTYATGNTTTYPVWTMFVPYVTAHV
jgi:hypothetical protein